MRAFSEAFSDPTTSSVSEAANPILIIIQIVDFYWYDIFHGFGAPATRIVSLKIEVKAISNAKIWFSKTYGGKEFEAKGYGDAVEGYSQMTHHLIAEYVNQSAKDMIESYPKASEKPEQSNN